MEQFDFQDLLAHPERLDADSLLYLRGVVARYPYFQTAWVLYLKNLFITGDPAFKDELKRGALFVADLSVLFYYIEGERFLIKKHVTNESSTLVGSDRTLDLIDRFLSETPEQVTPQKAVAEIPIPMEMPGDYTSVLLSEVDDVEKQASPLHGQDLIDQFLEQTENSVSDSRPILNETSSEEISEDKKEQETKQDTTSEELDNETEESYFTETLAKIYVRQQRYDKALEIIKKIYLKYPKKNAYFADQIRFLEKLIINAKSK